MISIIQIATLIFNLYKILVPVLTDPSFKDLIAKLLAILNPAPGPAPTPAAALMAMGHEIVNHPFTAAQMSS